MELYITELSKYFIVLFAALYTYESFVVFRYRREEERSGIYLRQNLLMFCMHFTCFLSVFLKSGKIEVIFFFVFQQIALYTAIVLYHMLYPRVNRLVVNNMCFLLAVGFVMLTRLSYDKAVKQFVIVVFSLTVALILPWAMTKCTWLKRFTWGYAIIGLAALATVLVLGAVTNGSKLTYSLFGISFQPSEFVKILFVFFVAGLLSRSTSLGTLFLSALVAGGHVLILVLSRDLGSALIFFVAYVAMVYIATGRLRYLLLGAAGGCVASVVAYRLFSHVRVRVQAWRDPWSVIDGSGFQIAQSLFAVSCGGLFGLGIYQGSPSSIPHVETDFIFSAITEELGVLFSVCLVLVYLSCFVMFMEVAMNMKEEFYRLTAAGLGITYIFQIFLTIGGGIKFIPLTGVTLPLISYGGSSVLATLVMFAIIQGLYLIGGKPNGSERKRKQKKEKAESGNHQDSD